MASISSGNGNEDVLESQQFMKDGTIDAIRLKIINHLKAIEELKNSTITVGKRSKVRNISGCEKQTKRDLVDALRQDQETPALERASKSVWELIMDNDGLGKEINEIVERVFCPLSGREPPLFSPSNSKVQQDNVKEKENSGEEKEIESLDSSSKKRDFSEMRVQTEEGEAAEGSDSRTVAAADCETSMEPEPGKCRRMVGKTLRCSRECVPDKNYCERHRYGGRKSRKLVESTDQGTSSNNLVHSNPNISTCHQRHLQ